MTAERVGDWLRCVMYVAWIAAAGVMVWTDHQMVAAVEAAAEAAR